MFRLVSPLQRSSLYVLSFRSCSNEISDVFTGYQTIVERDVEWGTMDAFQHVNNVQYIRWFETVRVVHMTDMALTAKKRDFLSASGVGPILKDVYCLFKVRNLLINLLFLILIFDFRVLLLIQIKFLLELKQLKLMRIITRKNIKYYPIKLNELFVKVQVLLLH